MPKKKQTKADFLRSWGLPSTFQYRSLRYKNPPEKGVYWYWFSIDIRQRDIKKYGVCIACGKEITMENCDAGHFISAHGCGRDLLFDPMNVHAECKGCNGFDENHLHGYERGIVERHGQEQVIRLRRLFFDYKDSTEPIKDFTRLQYVDMILALPSYQQFAGRTQPIVLL